MVESLFRRHINICEDNASSGSSCFCNYTCKHFVQANPKSSLSLISDSLSLSKETVRLILVEELLFRKVCSVWIPHKLTEENRVQRVACAKSILQLFVAHSMEEIMRIFTVEDETWALFETPTSKSENKVWIPPGTPRPRVVRQQMTWRKTMLSIAFTGNGKVSVAVTEKGESIDSDHYVQFVHRTGELWRKLRSDSTRLNELIWMHDNARPHVSASANEFFETRGICLLRQSPYSPDFNLCDRWLFAELKKGFKSISMDNPTDVMNSSLQLFRSIPTDRFQTELIHLKQHCALVIKSHGDYITK
jgi:transposase